MIPRLSGFTADNPAIRLRIDAEIALARFDDSGPDLGIRHGPGQWPGLTAHHLMDEPLFPVAAPTLPGIGNVAGPADVATLPLIGDLAQQGWRDWFRACGCHRVRIDERLVFGDSTDMLEAAACGLGAALARKRIVEPWLASGRLQRLPGPELASRFAYYIVHPSHQLLRPSARKFVDWLLTTSTSDP